MSALVRYRAVIFLVHTFAILLNISIRDFRNPYMPHAYMKPSDRNSADTTMIDARKGQGYQIDLTDGLEIPKLFSRYKNRNFL
jgi:hypothetical protein